MLFRSLLPLAALLALSVASPAAHAQAAANAADIERIAGPGWRGTLTYRDYTTEARTTIQAAPLLVRLPPPAGGGTRWEFRMAYADEPHANSGDTITLSADGRRFRDADVVERQVLADGRVQLVTEQDGRDNDRPARIRTVYLLGERAASLRKLVRYEGGTFFERHVYSWTR